MLTELAIKAAKPRSKQYRMADAHGLYLLVRPDGARWWRWDYRRPSGKRNTLSLGVYPEISLKKARDKCEEVRRQVKDGADPGAKRQEEREALVDIFEAVAREWFARFAKMGADSLQQNHRAAGERYLPLARVAAGEGDHRTGATGVFAPDRGLRCTRYGASSAPKLRGRIRFSVFEAGCISSRD